MNDLASAQHLLHQKRAALPEPPAPSDQPRPISDLATNYQLPAPTGQTLASDYRPVTFDQALASLNLPRLDDLTTDHLNSGQRQNFNELLATVRRWRGLIAYTPGLSFAILSPNIGIGKTHIAQSVATSFASITGDLAYENDLPLFSIQNSARIYTARELINLLGGDNAQPLSQIAPAYIRCLVIDDLGREGYLDYVKASDQQNEKQARYFHLIDYIYKRRRGSQPVSLFITSNYLAADVENLIGPAAWDRLLELAPRGYIREITGLPSYRRIASGRSGQ